MTRIAIGITGLLTACALWGQSVSAPPALEDCGSAGVYYSLIARKGPVAALMARE